MSLYNLEKKKGCGRKGKVFTAHSLGDIHSNVIAK